MTSISYPNQYVCDSTDNLEWADTMADLFIAPLACWPVEEERWTGHAGRVMFLLNGGV